MRGVHDAVHAILLFDGLDALSCLVEVHCAQTLTVFVCKGELFSFFRVLQNKVCTGEFFWFFRVFGQSRNKHFAPTALLIAFNDDMMQR